MSLRIKSLHGGGLQVKDPSDHRVIFSPDDLRSHSCTLRTAMVEGSPELPDDKANLLVCPPSRRRGVTRYGLIPAAR